MAFRDFSFPDVQHAFGLTLAETDLFGVVPLELTTEFAERMRAGVDLALAVSTDKARSEFIIAPVLLELRRLLGGGFGLFSGVEFDVDASRGLNGYCDFLLARSPLQSVLTAPVIAIVEAKNDNLRNGLGQCIAEMVAAREFNAKSPGGRRRLWGRHHRRGLEVPQALRPGPGSGPPRVFRGRTRPDHGHPRPDPPGPILTALLGRHAG